MDEGREKIMDIFLGGYMKTRTMIAGLAAALMVLSVPFVYADNGPGDDGGSWHQGGGWHHGDGEHMFAKVLDLSDTQVKQLKAIHEQQRQAMKSTMEQMKSIKEAFDAEIVKSSPDMNKINSVHSQIKTLFAQMLDSHLNSILAVKKIMTPEQFAGYMALKKEKKLMMRHTHGRFEHKNCAVKAGHHEGHGGWDKDSD
jgi:Spy/CpxP family protein refolding chaperone